MPTKKKHPFDDGIDKLIDGLEEKIAQSDDDAKIAAYTDEIDRLEQVQAQKIEPTDCDLFGHEWITGNAIFPNGTRLTTWCFRCGELRSD